MIPTTVIAGFLGAGKTSAITHLAAARPAAELWVVLVNEFGELGIDGAILGSSGLRVAELPGGCLCCSGDAPFRITLRRLLSELTPARLLLEPSGLADVGRLLDTLDEPQLAERLDRRATLTLVDPRRFLDATFTRRGDWRSQVEAADVLIGNRCDRVDGATLRAFLRAAAALYPPKQALITTTFGQLDPALLDLPAAPRQATGRQAHHSPLLDDRTGRIDERTARRLLRRLWSGPDYTTAGWRFGPKQVFSWPALEALLGRLAVHGPLVEGGAMRVKGVLHSDRGWRIAQSDQDGVRWSRTAWRTDSRLELIAPPGADLDAIEAQLHRCLLPVQGVALTGR